MGYNLLMTAKQLEAVVPLTAAAATQHGKLSACQHRKA